MSPITSRSHCPGGRRPRTWRDGGVRQRQRGRHARGDAPKEAPATLARLPSAEPESRPPGDFGHTEVIRKFSEVPDDLSAL
jgi:hypothetical protein